MEGVLEDEKSKTIRFLYTVQNHLKKFQICKSVLKKKGQCVGKNSAHLMARI